MGYAYYKLVDAPKVFRTASGTEVLVQQTEAIEEFRIWAPESRSEIAPQYIVLGDYRANCWVFTGWDAKWDTFSKDELTAVGKLRVAGGELIFEEWIVIELNTAAVEQAWQRGRFDSLKELVTEDFLIVSTSWPDIKTVATVRTEDDAVLMRLFFTG